MGFERDMLLQSLKVRSQNKATVTYWLLVDNRRKLPSSGYLSAELNEPGSATAGAGNWRLPSQSGAAAAAAANSNAVLQQRLVAERKWRLGATIRGAPAAIMAELYRVLQAKGVTWKKVAPYNLRCRTEVRLRLPSGSRPSSGRMSDGSDEMQFDGDGHHVAAGSGGGGGGGGNHLQRRSADSAGGPTRLCEVKFEAMLYKARDDEFVLDVQRLAGDMYVFMDVCGRMMVELRSVV